MLIRQKIENLCSKAKDYATSFFAWLLLSILVGVVCGTLGAFFSKSITFVTELRSNNPWLLYFLPIGGLASVGIYKLSKLKGVDTNKILENIRRGDPISLLLAPVIFVATLISHLFGGSAGREGAALQLGASVSSVISKLFRLDERTAQILAVCSMGSLFSALFGTPLGASVFVLEVVSVGNLFSFSIFPCIASSFVAYIISGLMGVMPERYSVGEIPVISFDTFWRVLVIAGIGAIVSIVFCLCMKFFKKFFQKAVKNDFVRIFIGGTLIIALTLLLGTTDYNGGGGAVIERVFEGGDVRYEAFALKMLFTVITLCSGFKGGEIVPTLFIGATLGGALGPLLGLSQGIGAAVGMAALFAGATNCPLSSIIICIELFGSDGMIIYALAVAVSYLFSGSAGLYTGIKTGISPKILRKPQIKAEAKK